MAKIDNWTWVTCAYLQEAAARLLSAAEALESQLDKTALDRVDAALDHVDGGIKYAFIAKNRLHRFHENAVLREE